MAAEAIYLEDADILLLTAGAGYASGEVLRLDDGRAAVVQGLKAIASGDVMGLRVNGRHELLAGSSKTFSRGEEVYWDVSANTAIKASEAEDGDFYVGPAAKAKTSGQTRVQVDLNQRRGEQRGAFTSRVREIDHADGTTLFTLIDAVENPQGLALVAFLGEITEVTAGAGQDQLIITLYDEDDNAIDTLTSADASADAVGDLIVGAVSMFSSASGVVFKKIPAGKSAYAKISQATSGAGMAGKMKVRAMVMPLA